MSLINDALKRASQSDRNRPSQAALPRPMQPVDTARASRFLWVLPVIVAVALVLAGWFFWKWWEASHPAVAADPAPVPVANAVVAATPPPATPVPPPPAPVAAPPAKAPEPIPTAPIAEPAWPMELTLKGIFYNKTSPRALINGKTVGPGESIGGVLVARIETDRVVVEWNGRSKELLLEGR
jgi:hypothetical protein